MKRRTLVAASVPIITGSLAYTKLQGNKDILEAPTARLQMVDLADVELPHRILHTIQQNDNTGSDKTSFGDILDDGARIEAQKPPYPVQRHVIYEEDIYNLSSETVDKNPALRFSATVAAVNGPVNESELIEFADLPKVDRHALAAHGLDESGDIGYGASFLYTENELEQSMLARDPTYTYIRWDDGRTGHWTIGRSSNVTVHTYRYTAEHVATATEYTRQLQDRFSFTLRNLTEKQKAMIETAIAGEYIVESHATRPPGFEDLIDRFREQEHVHGLEQEREYDGVTGGYLVTYEDTVYWTKLLVSDTLK